MLPASPLVQVVVPSYNKRSALLAALESVVASDYPNFRVLVVDDCSQDDSVAAVRRSFPDCEVLVNARNQGFAAGCNAGFQVALSGSADLVFLLNQDTLVEPDLLSTLVRSMREHPQAGIIGPKTYSFDRMSDGRPRLIYAGSWRRMLPLRQRIPGIEQAEDRPRAEPIQADYVWGHGMLIRSAALRVTGGFDTSFPMYYEDLDLCRRMREAGYEIWCEPSAVMWHDQPDGARAIHSEYWRWACKVRSTTVFHRKHYGRVASLFLTPMTILAEARQLLFAGRMRALGHLLLASLSLSAGFATPSPRR